jgi:hypothetical protein
VERVPESGREADHRSRFGRRNRHRDAIALGPLQQHASAPDVGDEAGRIAVRHHAGPGTQLPMLSDPLRPVVQHLLAAAVIVRSEVELE